MDSQTSVKNAEEMIKRIYSSTNEDLRMALMAILRTGVAIYIAAERLPEETRAATVQEWIDKAKRIVEDADTALLRAGVAIYIAAERLPEETRAATVQEWIDKAKRIVEDADTA